MNEPKSLKVESRIIEEVGKLPRLEYFMTDENGVDLKWSKEKMASLISQVTTNIIHNKLKGR